MRGGLVALVLVGVVVGRAQAQSRSAIAAAKVHFKAGEELYRVGEYADAIREWSDGYALVPRAAFLLNLGQAYRKMKNWPKAAGCFERYLRATRPGDPRRGEVRELLAEMRRRMAPPPAAPPDRAAEAPPILPVAAPAPAAIAPTPTSTNDLRVARGPARARDFFRRRWWIVPAGAVALGVVLGVSIYYGTRPARLDCSGTISCIDATARAP